MNPYHDPHFNAIEQRLWALEAKADSMHAMLLTVDAFLKSNLDHAKAAELHSMIRKLLEDFS